VILVETELWPNLIHYSKASGAAVVVVNARLSEKSCKGYERVGLLSKPMLRSIDCIGAQTASDATRFRRLGVTTERLTVTGNLKFEMQLPADHAERRAALAAQIAGKRPVWIAASTREGEDAKVLRAFRLCLQRIPDLLLILVPRHPERFAAAALLCEEQGLQVVTRSSGKRVSPETRVLLGDSMGELLAYYSISDVAFVGGSLVDTGCQNVLEPAALGLPVLTGPSRYNFAEACELLQSAGNLRSVADESALAAEVAELLGDPIARARMGKAGMDCIQANRGALQRSWHLILNSLSGAGSRS
jgi:3-deoxy-D-manno-octulosonic-acid transferase